jgi:hypothetical protein
MVRGKHVAYGTPFPERRGRPLPDPQSQIAVDDRICVPSSGSIATRPDAGYRGRDGAPTSDLPLYRESDVRICAATGDPLYVVESESSVDALNEAGHYTVTWPTPGGAAAPPLTKLAGVLAAVSDVRVVAEHDKSGIRCARTILTAVPHATGWLPPRAGG